MKADNGYVEQDVIQLNPDTPNLEGICAQFKDEHLHTDDEVRFVLSGEGIFDIRSGDDRWMRVTVSAGDLIVVPKDRYHRFFLTDQKHIRCVRLFQDTARPFVNVSLLMMQCNDVVDIAMLLRVPLASSSMSFELPSDFCATKQVPLLSLDVTFFRYE